MLVNTLRWLGQGQIDTYPAFDVRAMPVYAAITLGVALTLSFLVIGGFRFADPFMAVPAAWCVGLFGSGLLSRRYGHPRIGGACETIGLIYSQGLLIESCLPMVTFYSAPLADSRLAQVDRLLGFDWVAFVTFFRESPTALQFASVLYMSFMWQAAAILIILFAMGLEGRAWRFVTAAAIALLITVAIYPFAPAVGAFVHFGIRSGDYPNLNTQTPWSFAPAIYAMKSGTKLITWKLMVGYISFPSYHAASALLFTWAAWPLRHARWFFLFINVGMAASAMIIGAHYLIDLVAGALVALIALRAAGGILTRLSPSDAVPLYQTLSASITPSPDSA